MNYYIVAVQVFILDPQTSAFLSSPGLIKRPMVTFSVADPNLWNALAISVRQSSTLLILKRNVKTFRNLLSIVKLCGKLFVFGRAYARQNNEEKHAYHCFTPHFWILDHAPSLNESHIPLLPKNNPYLAMRLQMTLRTQGWINQLTPTNSREFLIRGITLQHCKFHGTAMLRYHTKHQWLFDKRQLLT